MYLYQCNLQGHTKSSDHFGESSMKLEWYSPCQFASMPELKTLESIPVVFLVVKLLNCVLNNSGFKISCGNNYFYDSPNTEGLFVITVTRQWSFQCCCHRALIKIQASYLSFSSSTGKPLNNKEKHEQEKGSIPNALAWSPLPGKWLFGLCVLGLLVLCSFNFYTMNTVSLCHVEIVGHKWRNYFFNNY